MGYQCDFLWLLLSGMLVTIPSYLCAAVQFSILGVKYDWKNGEAQGRCGGRGGGREWSGEAISVIVVMAKRGSSDYSMRECAACFSTAASM